MTSVQDAVELAERMSHRGLVRLDLEQLLRTIVGDGYTVRGVYTDWQTEQIFIQVVHPALREVAEGCQSPILNTHTWATTELRVLPSEAEPELMEVWERSCIELDSPYVKDYQAREELIAALDDAIMFMDRSYVLAVLRRAVEMDGAPRGSTEFVHWLSGAA